ncbi:hypothetical protein ACGFZ3_17025 [Stenotrophomonas sp. NPDC047960]|jgi:hypothetical protein|uniref:hypothetical protein n=1 Tax=Stenotrophomonas sp. NPDC047960 TaxID=3364531 RepID=UPI003718F1A1
MIVRPDIQARLDALDEMLAHWLAHMRHPAQFWPQFELLAAEILDQCNDHERRYVHARITAILKGHALELPSWHERGDSPSPEK